MSASISISVPNQDNASCFMKISKLPNNSDNTLEIAILGKGQVLVSANLAITDRLVAYVIGLIFGIVGTVDVRIVVQPNYFVSNDTFSTHDYDTMFNILKNHLIFMNVIRGISFD